VNQSINPQRNQRAVGKVLAIETRPSGETALHSHSAKSPEDGDMSRWLTQSKTLAMSSVPCEAS